MRWGRTPKIRNNRVLSDDTRRKPLPVMRGLPCKNRKKQYFFARKSGAKCLARRKGFEPLTPRFEVWCSIQLSYRRLGRTVARRPKAAGRRINTVFAPP